MAKIDIVEKNGKKYIDAEEILHEYAFEANFYKEIIFLFVGAVLFGYAKSENFDLNILWLLVPLALIIGFFYFLMRDIRTYKSKGVYVTQTHLITYSGEKVRLEDIYYHFFNFTNPSGFFWWTELGFYQNNRFLFYCKVMDNEFYQTFINVLAMISKNNILLTPIRNYNSRQKLILGENNGK
jgi:hypothetical protein